MPKALWTLLLCLCLGTGYSAAQNKKDVAVHGQVTDPAGMPLEGVLVEHKESRMFTLTDRDGNFTIRIPGDKSSLIFTLEGYAPNQVYIGDTHRLKVTLLEGGGDSDPEIALLYGRQNRSLMTSAVSTIEGSKLTDLPTNYANTALSGMIPGIATSQNSGAPGSDYSWLYVRGLRSWRNSTPLIMLDGHVRDFSILDPNEIDQISVYKDAGALAVLGLRGSNGAIMATTRRGKEGRPVLKFNTQITFQQPIKLPKFLDSHDFALLHNEAMRNDGRANEQRYNEEDLALYRSGQDPWGHPNVDWIGQSLKNVTVGQKYNLSIEGGSSVAKYFVNLSYRSDEGIYKTDKDINTYKTNANAKIYSLRSNVDIALTKSMDLSINLFGLQRQLSNPGAGSPFSAIYSLPSNAFPMNYGKDKVAGTNDLRNNPYGILNHSGYTRYTHSTMEAQAELGQKLDFITKGLRVRGSLAFDFFFENNINRSKSYVVYEYTGDGEDGKPLFNTWGEEKKQANSNSYGAAKTRIFDVEAGLDYDRTFGKHLIAATLFFNYSQKSDDTQNLPNTHQGLLGRATYAYDSRYIVEFLFGYQGTEQMPPQKRYGFFPAVSAGWVLSEESFIKNHIGNILSYFKVRGSWGITGNDAGIPYYFYLPAFIQANGRYTLGAEPQNVNSWVEDVHHQYLPNVTWEKSEKTNVGVDMRLFKNHLSISADYFREFTSQILTPRNTVSTLIGYGTSGGPLGNVGKTYNSGFEVEAAYSGRIKDFHWTLGGYASYAHNEIRYNDEQPFAYDYRSAVGYPINSQYGFQANGLYTSEQDRYNSPKTTFGTSYAGDIKYRDLNGDGVVDNQDQHRIGYSNLGEINYAFFANAQYKGFDFQIIFSGAGNRDAYLSGVAIQAFTNISGSGNEMAGNVRRYHWDNRYIPEDPATWTTAKYPRLSLTDRDHNYKQTSSFWVDDASFLRLKNLVIGYTLPLRISKKLRMSKLRIYYSGYNLFTWSDMRTIDPEDAGSGNGYPIQKSSSIGINIHF